MKSSRRSPADHLQAIALQAPFVAAHRLANELTSSDPVRAWFGWQAVAWEKWFAGAEAAASFAQAALRPGVHDVAGAALAPFARRVLRNAGEIRRAGARRRR